MSKKRKRISRRRLAGQRVLAHVPTFNIRTGKHKPVTAARRFIAEKGLSSPAILNVRRNEHTTDRFFWGEKGLFSAQYAEENHFLFPSLRNIVDNFGENKMFDGIEVSEVSEISEESEGKTEEFEESEGKTEEFEESEGKTEEFEESEEYEYAFV